MPVDVAGVKIPKAHHWRPSWLAVAVVLLIAGFLFQAISGKVLWKGLGK